MEEDSQVLFIPSVIACQVKLLLTENAKRTINHLRKVVHPVAGGMEVNVFNKKIAARVVIKTAMESVNSHPPKAQEERGEFAQHRLADADLTLFGIR